MKLNRFRRFFSAVWLAAATSLMMAPAWAVNDSVGGPKVNQLNLHEPATKLAADIGWLHWAMLIICLVIFIGVFGVMFYSIYAHRKSKGHKAATFHESMTAEIAWTIVPLVIVMGMGAMATKSVVAIKDTSNADITIKATGYQWKWGYDYLKGEGEGIGFLSNIATPREQIDDKQFPDAAAKRAGNDNYLIEVDNPLVVPIGKKVRMVLTANDVIHAWAVPSFAVKQDAIPGFVRDTWFRAEKIGTYRGECQELCGKDHAFMPIVVNVVSAEDYSKWVDGKKKELAAQADDPTKTYTLDELKSRGEKVFGSNCAACHQATGKGIPGTFPALDASANVLGEKAGQIDILLHGKNVMPKWAALSDVELAAVATYTRNAWSNAGKGKDPIVQPADFTAARK
ncbi:MAG: cytochrome c oxidase subunit II [Burkholderiaceae bacterium]|nr:MAG: cytochrome c oxidase subunit II [Burkholderiaceae bacterium]